MSDEPQGGTLYLIATPIGNLGDITVRAAEYMKTVDLLLAEDTRRTGLLLQHLGFKRPLRPFHSYNQSREIPAIVRALEEGKSVGLVSDGGTPGISDPAFSLVRAAVAKGLIVSSLPGASALTAAIPATGLVPHRFVFAGFLPVKSGRKRTDVTGLLGLGMPVVIYESPMRLVSLLTLLVDLAPERPCAVCREMTKLHEEIRRGTADQLRAWYEVHPPKGECVLVIGNKDERAATTED